MVRFLHYPIFKRNNIHHKNNMGYFKSRLEGKMRKEGRPRFLCYLVVAFWIFVGGCAGTGAGDGGGQNAAQNPCPDNAPALGPTSGPGGLLFFTGCGLWAVDPAQPASPAQIASEFIPGSLQKIVKGDWNVGAQKVTGKHLHALLYAKGENRIPSNQFFSDEKLSPGDEFANGRFYKISALKGQSQSPVQVSSESRANKMCGVVAGLEDYQNIDHSLYVYSMPGPDDSCTIGDDNLEKIIRLGMGPNDDPITLPRGRDAFTIGELVDKDNGAITGWLAIKSRRQDRRLPNYTTQADASQDVLKPHKIGHPSKPYPLGFFTGTPILVSGPAAVGGLNTYTSYYINPDPPANISFPCPEGKNDVEVHFPQTADPTTDPEIFDSDLKKLEQNAFNLKLRKRSKKICLADGAILSIRYDASDTELANLETQIAGRRVVKAIVIEEAVNLTANGDVTLNTQASYIALHRCNIDLSDCGTALKQTTFTQFCVESGFDQVGNEGNWLADPFIVGAYDAFNQPVSGELVQWTRVDDPEFEEEDHTTTNGSGKVGFTGKLGDDDETPGWNVFKAKPSGIGSPLVFSASKPPAPTEFTPPFCKRREEFYMLGVFPQSTRGSKAAFIGKMAVRIDLLYQPYWNLADHEDDDGATKAKKAEKRNKAGTQGVLYVYDVAANTFSVDVPYNTNDLSINNQLNAASLKYISSHEIDDDRSAFPDGLFSVYDNDMYFFSDFGKIFRMPLSGNGKAVQMVNEGDRKILDMKLTVNNLVYTPVDLKPERPVSAVKSVAKGGGGAIFLHPDTQKTVLNLVTDPDWHYVYFETLQTKEDLPNPGVYSQVYAGRADGSQATKETKNATMAGQSDTRVLSVVNCNASGLFSCKGGTLVSTVGADLSNQLSLGTLPGDIDAIFFQGNGEGLLGEGYADSDVTNVDIFHLKADQADTLIRSVTTPFIPESNL